MANEKTYSDYLMHGRTKGSRNGISTTKGYTAVGQKAKGHWVNGRYVYDTIPRPKYQSPMDYARSEGYARYKAHKAVNNKKLTFDTPKSYSGNSETNEDTYMIRDGKNVYETPSVPAGVATYPTKKKDWAKEAASYSNHVDVSPQGGFDAEMLRKRKKWLSDKAQANGSKNNWQQQGNAHRSALTMNNANRRSQDYRGMPASVTSEIIPRDNAKMEKRPEVKAFNAWHNARQQHNAEVAGKNAALSYAKKQKAKRQTNIGAYQAADAARNQKVSVNNIKSGKTKAANMTMDGIEFTVSGKGKTIAARDDVAKAHYNAVSQAAAERKAREAALERQKKASLRNAAANGANNNWQQDWNTSFERNHRSDIGNAIADAKEDAKKAFKEAKADAKQTYVNLKSKLKSKFKKKKK